MAKKVGPPWTTHIRTTIRDLNGAGTIWICNPNTGETVVDTESLDVFPLSDEHRRLIDGAPWMEKALAHILVLVQQGVDDNDTEAIESHCRDALGRVWGVRSEDVWTPDLAEFETEGGAV